MHWARLALHLNARGHSDRHCAVITTLERTCEARVSRGMRDSVKAQSKEKAEETVVSTGRTCSDNPACRGLIWRQSTVGSPHTMIGVTYAIA